MAELKSGITVVLGGQWGDEGKGKLVDILAQEADVVARCQVRVVDAPRVLWRPVKLLWDPPTSPELLPKKQYTVV